METIETIGDSKRLGETGGDHGDHGGVWKQVETVRDLGEVYGSRQ